jgi:hypothetical protein
VMGVDVTDVVGKKIHRGVLRGWESVVGERDRKREGVNLPN